MYELVVYEGDGLSHYFRSVVLSVFESSLLRSIAISSVSSCSPEVLAKDSWAYAVVSHEDSTYWGKTLDVV